MKFGFNLLYPKGSSVMATFLRLRNILAAMICIKTFFGICGDHRNITMIMGVTKSEIFTEKQNKLASMLKALAHPARIAIIEHLIQSDSCICGDLVEELGLAQATISQHLKELKKAGFIKGSIEGASVCYCIDEKAWKQHKALIEKLFVSYEAGNSRCC